MYDYSQLFGEQTKTWILAKNNYQALSTVLTKEFQIDGIPIRLQFNPGRIVSSTANTSKDAIQARPCFLCSQNRPVEQTSLNFEDETTQNGFQILVNPFPVFPQHFTIASNTHIPQAIEGHFGALLGLAKEMEDLVVFYNGPGCGASAPDHLHFQAGSKGFMPIEAEYETWSAAHRLAIRTDRDVQLYQMEGLLQNGWILEGSNKSALTDQFNLLLEGLKTQQGSDKEPLLNLICWHQSHTWICIVLPRLAHRPACYFREEGSNFLISPASVEMGGLMIAVRKNDFERLTEKDVRDIYKDVTLPIADMDLISEKLVYNELTP